MIVIPEFQRIYLETKEVSSIHLFVITTTGQNGRFHQFVRNSERNAKENKHIKNSNIEEVKEKIYRMDQLIEDQMKKLINLKRFALKMTRTRKYYQNFMIKES